MPLRRVISLRFATPDLFELMLERGDETFQPGDCVALFNPAGESRPYSIASGVTDTCLRLIVRRITGGEVSAWLAQRRPGEMVEVSPPFGWFRPGPTADFSGPAVWIATGTGIAPFLSVLRTYPEYGPTHLLHGVRIFADGIETDFLSKRCPMRLAVSRERTPGHHHGRVTDLLEALPRSPGTHYYLCGLDAMINETSAWLEQRGIAHANVHREVFFKA